MLLFSASQKAGDGIRHLPGQPDLPQFRFEWHSKSHKVYVVDIPMGERIGRVEANCFDWHSENEGRARNAILLWCRGFRAAKNGTSHNDQGKLVIVGDHK